MVGAWIRANVWSLVAGLALAGFVFQTLRIDGVPLFYVGYRTQLAECRAMQQEANDAATAAANKAREEGRVAALADAQRLAADEAKRKADADKALADLRAIVARLQRPQPPVTVRVEGGEPIVVTPAVGMCLLDREAVNDLRAALNRGR